MNRKVTASLSLGLMLARITVSFFGQMGPTILRSF